MFLDSALDLDNLFAKKVSFRITETRGNSELRRQHNRAQKVLTELSPPLNGDRSEDVPVAARAIRHDHKGCT